MKQWRLTCSIDATNIDYETTIYSDTEPGHWTCDEIAQNHGCTWWSLEEARAND